VSQKGLAILSKRTVAAVILSYLIVGDARVHAQDQSAQANLDAGIRELREGNFIRALVTLNDVIAKLSMGTGQSTILARAHAYEALAYTQLGDPDAAKTSALLALTASPNIVIDPVEFTPAAVALFAAVRGPSMLDPEAAAGAAEQSGRFQEAFVAYLRAFQALPDPPPAAADARLREKVIRVAQQLAATPLVPQEARDHLRKAQDLADAEAILGGTSGTALQQAVELRQAIRLAPWWPDPMIRYATVLQKLQRVDEALLNLNLYRLADPDGYAAIVGRAAPKALPEATAPAAIPTPVGPAVIYVYWPEQQRGGGRQKVMCNARKVADLQNNRFMILKAGAGTYHLTFRNNDVTAVVEGGREYYYRASIEGQFQFAQGAQLRPVSTDAAKVEMREQKMKINDAKRTFGAECTAAAPARGRGRQ
jgi:tetratricopeptide (TPR) repeat protein